MKNTDEVKTLAAELVQWAKRRVEKDYCDVHNVVDALYIASIAIEKAVVINLEKEHENDTDTTTLPEALINAIKNLATAQENFCREVEEFTTLATTMQASIDRLVTRQQKLANINLTTDKGPIPMPKAIVPREAAE